MRYFGIAYLLSDVIRSPAEAEAGDQRAAALTRRTVAAARILAARLNGKELGGPHARPYRVAEMGIL
jgi:hypothetical protein